MTGSDSGSNLLSALVQCFGIIIIGYVTGSVRKFSTTELKALNNFVQYFSLPALIFSSLVKLDFYNINWAFMASILVSKVVIFAAVSLITMIITRPANIGKAGLYAILATQSNDFALGYPLIVAVYGHRHPEYEHYIYFLAPIQLVILNPIGFLLIELQKQTNERRTNIMLSVLKGTFTNPVIIMTTLGIISNQVFQHQLPPVLQKLLDVLGSAYPATALFLLGLSLVGKFEKMSGRAILVPILLIIVKILVLPLVIQKVVIQLIRFNASAEETNELSSFGFLYGTFPFAPAAYFYATHYNMPTDVVSTGMVMCTALAAPIMAISASMVSLPQTGLTLLHSDLLLTKKYSSIVTLILCLWIAVSFLLRKQWKTLTHKATLFILIAQLLLAIEGILSSLNPNPECLFVLKLFYIGSLSMLRIWTSILAIILLFLHWRSLCFVMRLNFVLTIAGIVMPLSLMAFVFGMNELQKAMSSEAEKTIFEYNTVESYIMLSITAVSFIVTGLCLIIQQRRLNHQASYEPISPPQNSVPNSQVSQPHVSYDIEDICNQMHSGSASYNLHCDWNLNCSSEQRKYCITAVQDYQESALNLNSDTEVHSPDEDSDIHDIHHHVIFLLLLSISMIVSLAICMWVLVMDTYTGISIELQFLDILLIYGQGILTFFVFEVDFKYIYHFCVNIYRQCRYGSSTIILPTSEHLSQSTHNICQQFRTYHQQRISAYCSSSGNSFAGKQLVDSLLVYGLVQSRTEGEQYGEHLLLGRIIQHSEQKQHFKDSMLLYEFVNDII